MNPELSSSVERSEGSGVRKRLPPWLRISLGGARPRAGVRRILEELHLNTVCAGAHCPNLCECWARSSATFLIMGRRCTRNCRFCAIESGSPLPLEADEPERLAEAAARLGLRFVVITSVTRDDLADGGASHFVRVIRAVRARLPGCGIEVLTPDFRGKAEAVRRVIEAGPDVFNHNLETCSRLTRAIRSGADYRRSLAVLRLARDLGGEAVMTKSGFMLGLGETAAEVHEMLEDLRAAGVDALTIGQYLAPSPAHWPVARFVPPEEFEAWGRTAREQYGFRFVASAPRVRSSYRAEEAAAAVRGRKRAGRGPSPARPGNSRADG